MTELTTPALVACLRKSERDPKVRALLAILGVKRLPAPVKETWKGMLGSVTVLNGLAAVVAPAHGVRLTFDFPADRDGFSERPLSYRGPRRLERIELLQAGRVDGRAVRAYQPAVLLEWTLAEPLEVLRRRAKERGKAYAKGSGKTVDSIRLGKVTFNLTRARGNTRAARVELCP